MNTMSDTFAIRCVETRKFLGKIDEMDGTGVDFREDVWGAMKFGSMNEALGHIEEIRDEFPDRRLQAVRLTATITSVQGDSAMAEIVV